MEAIANRKYIYNTSKIIFLHCLPGILGILVSVYTDWTDDGTSNIGMSVANVVPRYTYKNNFYDSINRIYIATGSPIQDFNLQSNIKNTYRKSYKNTKSYCC